MTILDAQHPQKLPARPVAVTVCDHCRRIVRCEQVRTLFGMRWHCADAIAEAKARPVETLSSDDVAQLRAAEDEMVDRQIDAEILAEESHEPLPDDDEFPIDVADDSPKTT